MAQWVKYLILQHEVLSTNPTINLDMVVSACNLRAHTYIYIYSVSLRTMAKSNDLLSSQLIHLYDGNSVLLSQKK